MFVRDWMASPVVTIRAEAALADALNVMEKHRIRRLPVLSKDRLVGILTRSDIDSYMGRSGRRDPRVISVEKAMTPNPVTVASGETLEGAAVAMTSRRISGLPVVDDGRLVGMITETNIFRALIDILGFSEGGARVVLSLSSPDSIASWIQRFSKGPVVRSLVTYRDPTTRNWKALVRLWGRKAKPQEVVRAGKENSGRR
jgi:acetoin utilization protein AcuB